MKSWCGDEGVLYLRSRPAIPHCRDGKRMNEKYLLLRDAVGWGNVEYGFTKRPADRPGMFRIGGKILFEAGVGQK